MPPARRTAANRAAAVLLAVALAALAASPAVAQEGALKGVVWTVPEGQAQAEQDLRAMADAGIEAVRSGLIRSEKLLSLADTLGIALYLDLPLSRLPAARMVDTLDYARAVVDTAAALAGRHRSIQAVGMARYADTSDPAACAVLDELHRRLRSRAGPGISTYYVTRFVENDVCSEAVDFVLIDARGAENPAELLRWWHAAHPGGSVGLAAFGVWVRSDTLRGLAVPASPERQARYLERHLAVLLSDTLSAPLRALFVYRWRDAPLSYANTAHDLEHPYLERYGLHAVDDTARPALRVVAGIFTGRQTVFAFERGTTPSGPAPWSVLFGWAVIASLGIFYALSPRFRSMLPRYFQARFFFRESVREGRDVLLGASSMLLAALGIASGLVTLVVADAVRPTATFMLALRWLPPTTQGAVATLLGRPLLFIVVVGCIHVTALLLWSTVLSVLSRRKFTLAPSQVLMLVVWPRWPVLAVMVAAMVAASLEEPNAYLIGGIVLTWMLIEVASALRTLTDFLAVTRIPLWLLAPAALLHPGVLLAGVLAMVVLGHQPEFTYLRHAAMRR